MNDYIIRHKAIEIINHYAEMALYRMLSLEPGSRAYLIAELQYGDRKHIRKMVEGIPSADVRPVVYGYWDDSLDGITPYCSVCGMSHRGFERTPPFCPHCGADMRGDTDTDEKQFHKECEDCTHCEVCGMVYADKGEPCAFKEKANE